MGTKLYGTFKLGAQNYFTILQDNKSNQKLFLLSYYPTIGTPNSAYSSAYRNWGAIQKGKVPKEYVVCAFEKAKSTNKIKFYGNINTALNFFNTVRSLEAYSFNPKLTEKKTTVLNGVYVDRFYAKDNKAFFDRELEDGLYSRLIGKLGANDITLTKAKGYTLSVSVTMQEVKDAQTLSVAQTVTLKTITYEALENILDLSWYFNRKTNQQLKKYKAITNVSDFENLLMQGLIDEYRRCKETGDEFIVSIDTETTGLNVYLLDNSNPVKSHCVAIPISFRDNEAFVIFTNMTHFDNISLKYAFRRLESFVTKKEDVILESRTFNNPDLYQDLLLDKNNYSVVDRVEFKRSEVDIVGHNALFDGRVFEDNGVRIYWDDDTLLMAFNINPKIGKAEIPCLREKEEELPDHTYITKKYVEMVKGGVGLKNITRRLFNVETPELSDVLGKGNEDKYGELTDIRVAELYGGADGDFTRLVRKELKKLMPKGMFETYRKQDMPLINILYDSEYNGLTVDSEAVKDLAQRTYADLQIIKKFLWNYVGMKVQYKSEVLKLKVKYQSKLQTMDIFSKSNGNIKFENTELYSEFKEHLKDIHIDKNSEYVFEMKATDLRKVLYDILEYPVVKYTNDGSDPTKKKLPSTDKYVMERLLRAKLKHNELSESIMSSDGKKVLIDKEEFNSYRYPIAYVLKIYGSMNKEYTSYFKPILEHNLEGRLFKNYSMARIETRRIMNPSQTMKSDLKALVLPYDGGKDYYMLDFDMAQVEYRIMISLAWLLLLGKYPNKTKEEIFEMEPGAENVYGMIEKLKHPEADFHRESAATLKKVRPDQIDNKFRKQMKSVHFGIPYGLGEQSLCVKMFGELTEENLISTRLILKTFKDANKPVIDMLEHARDNSFIPVNFSDEFKRFAGFVDYTTDEETGEIVEHLHNVGKVENLLGFYRLFDLENLDKKKEGVIRRAAGNYPIQSFAAELFRIILIRFYNRCVKEGIADKIKWHMLIHDELLLSAHKSVNPFFLYKIILEECMPTFPGHTNYYVGINIGDNWAECKNDSSEAPVLFVQRMVKRWDAGEFKNDTWIDDAKSYVNKYKDQYMLERVHEVLAKAVPEIENPKATIYCSEIFDKVTNYAVRGYLKDFFAPPKYLKADGTPNKYWNKGLNDDQKLVESLQYWVGLWYGEGRTIVDLDGNVIYSKVDYSDEINKEAVSTNEEEEEELIISDDYEEEESDWGFDEEGFNDYSESLYFDDYSTDDEDDDSIKYNFDKKDAVSVGDLIENNSRVKNAFISNDDTLMVTIENTNYFKEVLQYLAKFVVKERYGMPVRFLVGGVPKKVKGFVDKNINLAELDAYIEELKSSKNSKTTTQLSYVLKRDNTLVINLPKSSIIDTLKSSLAKYKTTQGYTAIIYAENTFNCTIRYLSLDMSIEKLDNHINNLCKFELRAEEEYKHITLQNSLMILEVPDVNTVIKLKGILKPYLADNGRLVRFKLPNTSIMWLRVQSKLNFKKLDDYIEEVVNNEKVRL